MAKNYRDNDEYENDSIFGENEEDEYLDYDDDSAEYEEDAEWADEDDNGDDEYADEDENEDYDGEYEEDSGYDEDEPEYDDETGYESEEPEEEYDDGSNYSIFKRLNRENGFHKADDDDYEDADEDDYYDDEPEEEPGDEQGETGKLTAIMERLTELTANDYIMYAMLILLPPLGILLMFYGRKWDSRKRTIWAVISVLCFVLLMYLIFGGGSNKEDPTLPNNNAFNQLTAMPTSNNATFSPVPTAEAVTPVPTSTVHTVGTDDTDPNVSNYVYATNSGIYYHTIPDCGGITNASKITLDVAQGRNLAACPDCAGGNNNYADPEDTSVTYYATPKGTYYHTISTCSGMTGASITTVSAATLAGKKACPVCIGYYGTDGGTWYHSVSNCQGMTNPSVRTEAEWRSAGKTACPICMGDSSGIKGLTVPSETQVFATTSGTYFHTKDNCSGMKNASQNSISRAVAMGKKPCTTCVKPGSIYVFATSNGNYYHTLPTCSGMKNAQYVTAETAVKNGKSACQTCAKMLTGIKGFGTSANADSGTTTTQTDTYVYCTTGGTYFHTDSKCSGMSGAKKVTYSNAVNANKKPCPTCVKASKITVFCTSGGNYYHTKSTCSGMTGAAAMTAAKAISYGKKACPTCAKALKSTASAENETLQVASAFTSVSTPVWSNLSSKSIQTAAANSTVYIDLSGENAYYHLIAKCPVMNFYNGHAVTLDYTLSNGIDACPVCNPPSDVIA